MFRMSNIVLSEMAKLLKWKDRTQRTKQGCNGFFFLLYSYQDVMTGTNGACVHQPGLTQPRQHFSSVSRRCDNDAVFLSCASVFPESPRWLLATTQILQVKKSLQEFTIRNGVCLPDEMYPGETLLSGARYTVCLHLINTLTESLQFFNCSA